MTVAWWGKDAPPGQRAGIGLHTGIPANEPVLVATTQDSVRADINARLSSYTFDWTNPRPGDPGDAFTRLFAEEIEPVLQRANQLPDKSYVEFLRTAGVKPLPPTPAKAVLQFTVSDSADHSISVAQGFQVGATPAGGGDIVIFETDVDLYATPAKIQELYALEKGFYRVIDATKDDVPFQPFGARPRPGQEFFIGIAAGPDVSLGPQLSLGIQLQDVAGQPPPVSTGGVVPLPAPLAPLLRWDALDGTNYQQLDVIADDTAGLLQSGVIRLSLPETWRPGIPEGAPDTSPLLWLRLQIQYGVYRTPPTLLSVKLNMVPATAVQTFRDEVLTPVPGTGGSVMSLSHTPVLPRSLQLAVDDTADLSFAPGSSGTPVPRLWREVDDLSEFNAADEVFVLDANSGEITFGDDVHGKAPPPGFRNITAISYQVGGGAGGAVGANKITTPVNSLPFISGVSNPMPASGGTDAETQYEARQRGPREIRARGRAVALADYEILALRSVGAQVARAHAVSGFHPSFPGNSIPGVVCVFVVPHERKAGPPLPDQGTLSAVSNFLSSQLSPAGVEIVTAAPVYHRVRVETSVVIRSTVSRGNAVRDVLQQINYFLDPITGGEDEQGWPFGGTLSYISLVKSIVTKLGFEISAVPRLAFVVDGVRGATCADFPISANSLVWPTEHQVLALSAGGQS